MNFQLTVGFSLGYMYFHMFNIRQKKEKKVDWICPFWNLVLLGPWKSLHGFVIPRCGYFIKFELFSSLKRQEFDQKVAKKFKCSTFSRSHPTPPPKNLSIWTLIPALQETLQCHITSPSTAQRGKRGNIPCVVAQPPQAHISSRDVPLLFYL